MDQHESISPNNVSYAVITGIIYFIVAKGLGSGIEFAKTLIVSLLDFLGGFAGLGDSFYGQSQNNLIATEPYFWFLFFVIGSIFSIGISYHLSDEGSANKLFSALGTTFSQLIIGRIVTLQRVTFPVQMVLFIVALGFYFFYCEKLHKNAVLIIMTPVLLPALELLIIFPFILVASMLPDILAVVVDIIGIIFSVIICYPRLNSYYCRNILHIDSSISSFNIIWVIGVLVFCLFFGNQPQESSGNVTNTDGMEYHNSRTERLLDMLRDMLERSANWTSDGEYERIKNGENVDSATESTTDTSDDTDNADTSSNSDNDINNPSYLDITVDEKLVFKSSDMEVTSLSLKANTNNDNRIILTVAITDKTNKYPYCGIKNDIVLINDIITAPAYLELSGTEGNTITANIVIDALYLYDFGIRRIGDIKFILQPFDFEIDTGTSYNGNETGFIDVRTSSYNQADKNLSLDIAITIYQGNDIRIIGKYVDSFGTNGDKGILMLIDNNSDYNCMFDFENIAINDKMVEYYTDTKPGEVLSGTKAIAFYDTSFSFDGASNNEDVKKLAFSLQIMDHETYDTIDATSPLTLIQSEDHEWRLSS